MAGRRHSCAVTIAIGLLGMLLGFVGTTPLAGRLTDGGCLGILIRGIPGLLVIYLLFYGSLDWVRTVAGTFGYEQAAENAYPMIVGVIAIAAISCAYSIEVIGGALQAVPAGMLEAARSLALPRMVTFFLITFPLALRIVPGGINNVWQTTIKDASLISVVGLQELMRTAAITAGIARSPLFFYCIAAAAMTLASQTAFSRIERVFNHSGGM